MLNGIKLCGIGIPGELCIAGDGLARGYLNRPELTKEKFIKNPYGKGRLYRTGDLARWLPDGNIEYLGRIDEQVKIRGFRIELGEIENVLRSIDCIKDVAVITREDASGDKAVRAYIVSDIEVDMNEIRKEIRKALPEYMIPACMMQIEKIPVTKNGKIDKRVLPDIVEENKKHYIAPRNETEEIIVRIFEEILERGKISVTDDFFAIGGHSLRATRMANRIEAETGVRIPLKIVFSEKTAEALARCIQNMEEKPYEAIPRSEVKEYYPMSSTQKRTYLTWKMNEESIVYNMPACYVMKGKVRLDDIRDAVQKIINRHEILRTCFVMQDGEPVQKILETIELDYAYEETIDKESEILKKFVKPFKLEEGNLIRVKVVKSKDQYYLLMDMHHIVSDGMSVGIFMNEFSSLYNQKTLEPLTLQYKDYSEWMRGRNLENQKTYWTNIFKEEVPVIELPYDYKRPSEQSYEGALTGIMIPREIKNGIMKLCRDTGTTEYMVFLAGLMVVLYKYSRQEDIVVGSPISGRTHKDTELMMGMFMNTLAIRQRPKPKKKFLDFLQEVKENCLKAYENQEYPFEELVEAVEVPRDFSRNPLFDVMFMLQNNEKVQISMDDVILEQIWKEHSISKFDLTISVVNQGDGCKILAEYCTKLFKEETVKGILEHFKQVILNVIRNPETMIGEIEVVTKEELELILNKFNDTYE
jgi:NRPS condensation-like uncharacterized protein/acyl carrier protein